MVFATGPGEKADKAADIGWLCKWRAISNVNRVSFVRANSQNKTSQTQPSPWDFRRTALPRKLLKLNLQTGAASVNGSIGPVTLDAGIGYEWNLQLRRLTV